MAMIDWDWPTQLEICQNRITELRAGIAIQEQKIQRHLDRGTNAKFAQRVLAIKKESLERVRGCKHLIETKIANRAADQHRTLPFFDEPKEPSNLKRSRRAEARADAAAQPQ